MFADFPDGIMLHTVRNPYARMQNKTPAVPYALNRYIRI